MSKFGWDYPPGAANDPNAPYNQDADDDTPAEQLHYLISDLNGLETELIDLAPEEDEEQCVAVEDAIEKLDVAVNNLRSLLLGYL